MSYIRTKTGSKCLICDDQIDPDFCVRIHKTRRQTHILCGECAVGYLKPLFSQITNNIRRNIRQSTIPCPGSYHGTLRNRCKFKIDIAQLKLFPNCELSTDLFRINYVLQSNCCVICNCGQVIEVDELYDGLMISCRDCGNTWCRQCNVSPYHTDRSCIEYEMKNKSSDNAKYILEMNKKGLIKFCPQCRTPIYRDSGCNKMICEQCQLKWCWLCEKPNIDYDHYNEANKTSCANKLWLGTELE